MYLGVVIIFKMRRVAHMEETVKHQAIGIIAATEFEITPFLQKVTDDRITTHARLNFHEGRCGDIPIVALFCGVCKVNAAIAAQVLISTYDVSKVIMIGIAGAIDTSLNILDTVISKEVAYHDVEDEILVRFHPWMEQPYFIADQDLLNALMIANADDKTVLAGKIVTGEAFIDQDGREAIIKKHNPQCVDMETASVAHVCYVNQIPFIAIRSISDTPHESGNESFAKYARAAAGKSIQVLDRYFSLIK